MKGTASGSSALHAGPTRSSHAMQSHRHHQPYRLEVCGITPVSISLLWSLRPLPLSAIPRGNVRHGKANANISSSASASSQGATKSLSGAHLAHLPLQRIQSESAGNAAVGMSSSITATRSPNRRVTKVSIRNVSPAQRNRGGKPSAPSVTSRRDSTDWPSDDGATAVEDEDEDDEGPAQRETDELERGKVDQMQSHHALPSQETEPNTPSETSEDCFNLARTLESGVSISVNGVPWSQVVVGDSSSEEAFVVIYGLQPARDYEILLSVDDKQSTVALATTAAEEEDKSSSDVQSSAQASRAVPSVSDRSATAPSGTPQPPVLSRIKRAHTPPMQDTEAAPSTGTDFSADPSANTSATLPSGVAEGAMTVASVQAAIRKARKDASRAESALRNEIEAIKRGLERMSDVDHRSKQKLLALQENIRQATTQAKDIDEEATAVENEREMWEEHEKEKELELEQVRSEVEETLRVDQLQIKGDNDEVEAMEKELQQIAKQIEEKRAEKEKLEKEKLAELEQQLTQMHVEIENTLRYPHPQPPVQPTAMPSAPFYAAAATGQQTGQGGQHSTALVPPHVHRGGARGGRSGGGASAGRGGGRGGAHHHASGGQQNGPAGRRNQHRQNQRYQQHGAQHHSSGNQHSGSDEYTSSGQQHGPQPFYDPNVAHSTVVSMLNPHNPEFIPSGNGTAQGSANGSPLVSRTGMLPDVASGFPPPRHPLNAYVGGEQDSPRRASTSHLDLSSFSSPGSSFATNAVAPNASSSTWLAGSSSPWAPTNVALAASPQLGHDIWRASPTTGAQLPHSPRAAPGGPTSSTSTLRTKTSIPFGLNASLLRGGANPSYVHSRLGDGDGSSSNSTLYHHPFDAKSPNSSATFPTRRFGSNDDHPFHHPHSSADGGNSAPVSPLHPQPAEMMPNTFGEFPTAP